MPDAPAGQRRRWVGVLASSALVLAAHAGILKWTWQGSGHSHAAATETTEPHTISATLLAAVPAPAPTAAPRTPTTTNARPSPRVVAMRSKPVLPTPALVEDTHASSATETAPANGAEPLDIPATDTASPSEPSAPDTTTDGTALDVAAAASGTTALQPPPVTTAPTLYAPPPGIWHYEVTGQAKGLSYQAEGSLHWQHDGQRYRAQMTLRALWLQRQQTSTGGFGPEGMRPEHFIDQARKTREIWFDPQQHTQHTGNGPPQPAPVGVQDRLSVFFQLATQLNRAAANAAPTHANWPIPVAGGADSETWHFEAQGSERQQLPAGVYDTVKFTRRPRHSSDQTVEVWLAPALHHIPVRLRIAQSNGDVVDQRLSGVAAAPPPHP